MVFAVVVLLYYWLTGGEIWHSAFIGRRELGLRAGATEGARCALTGPPAPPASHPVGVMAGGRHVLLRAQLVSAGTVAAYSRPLCLCWEPCQIS
jgi:hypothetical protein